MYGIDFGTSNTVATYRPNSRAGGAAGRSALLDLGEGPVLPSLLYFERDRRPSIGAEAMADYAKALERYHGEANLYGKFRFFQGLKLALKDEYFAGTRLFGELVPPEALVGIFLREVRGRADAAVVAAGEAPSPRLVLGRPVVLSPDAQTDRLLEERFRAAALRAGFEEVSFVSEPVAAATGLLGTMRGLVLVFDFGGGTLDITVARLSSDSIEILASEGADLGGFLLNEDVSTARIVGHFGAVGKWRSMSGRELKMPSWITRQVSSFHALPLADIAKTRSAIKDLIYDARKEDKPKLRGLSDFLDRNLSFSLFGEIDAAKIALSSRDSTEIAFAVPPHLSFRERLTRSEFEALAAPRVAAGRALVEAALARAGAEAGDIERVVRVGGSCRIPAFVRMLEGLFPGRVQEGAVFTSIASGLVEAADKGFAA